MKHPTFVTKYNVDSLLDKLKYFVMIIAKVRIKAKGHEPFYAEPAKVGTRRLLDAVARTADERERRPVISYSMAMEGDEDV